MSLHLRNHDGYEISLICEFHDLDNGSFPYWTRHDKSVSSFCNELFRMNDLCELLRGSTIEVTRRWGQKTTSESNGERNISIIEHARNAGVDCFTYSGNGVVLCIFCIVPTMSMYKTCQQNECVLLRHTSLQSYGQDSG